MRIDSGVEAGDQVSIHYDPMIAKIITSGADRAEAAGRMAAALAATEVVGLPTNRAFLQAIFATPAFAAADLDTGFIERHRAELLPGPVAPGPRDLALAALHVLLDEARASAAGADPADPHSPWGLAAGWRLNRSAFVDLTFAGREDRHVVRAHYVPGGFRLDLPGGSVSAEGTLEGDGTLIARLDGVRLKARVLRSGHRLVIFAAGTECTLEHVDPRFASAAAAGGAGRLVSPCRAPSPAWRWRRAMW